jgi:hypothetical protein
MRGNDEELIVVHTDSIFIRDSIIPVLHTTLETRRGSR